MRPPDARRRGFTLTELLVAMGLAIVILSLAVVVSQTAAFDSYRTTGSADKVSQWLIVAKQRALRDKQPRGVRLVVNTDPNDAARRYTVSECQYIEAPEPYFPANPNQLLIVQQVIDEADPTVGVNTLDRKRVLTTRVFLAGVNLADFELDGATNVQAKVHRGDTLLVPELAGQGFRIVGITNPAAALPTPTGVPTATYPFQFYNPSFGGGNPYNQALMNNLCPVPGLPSTVPDGPPMSFGRNGSGLVAVIELQLAAFPVLTPGYSKFAPWPPANPPILTPMAGPNPVYPPTSPTLAGQPVQLPFVGPSGSNPSVPEFNGTEARVPTLVTGGFGIYRQPRPLLGEPPLKLAPDAVIDLDPTPGANNSFGVYGAYTPAPAPPLVPPNPVGTSKIATQTAAPNPLVGYVDFLFTTGGDLLPNANASNSPIRVLLVRDVTKKTNPDLTAAGAYEASGPMALVAVFAKGGTVVTKPVASPSAANGNDPFTFAKDGLTGGL